MKSNNTLASLSFFVFFCAGLAVVMMLNRDPTYGHSVIPGMMVFVVSLLVSFAIKVADQWNRAVVLRLGKFHTLRGPGLFFIIPVVDTIPYWIDIRVITTTFKAEKTLTKDTVPVDVDAVLFWKVMDPKRLHWMWQITIAL